MIKPHPFMDNLFDEDVGWSLCMIKLMYDSHMTDLLEDVEGV